MNFRSRLKLLVLVATVFPILPACESTKPRGPQPKSSSVGWDHPKAGQGAGALGAMVQRQE